MLRARLSAALAPAARWRAPCGWWPRGGLSPELSRAVWAGFSPAARESGRPVAGGARRRSRGGDAARGCGSSRIAVHPPPASRKAWERKMIADIAADAAGYDYLSVSFGYTAELWRYRQRCRGLPSYGWVPIARPAAAAIRRWPLYPLTAAGRQLARREAQRLQRDEYWLRPWREESAPLPGPSPDAVHEVMRTGWKRRALPSPTARWPRRWAASTAY